MTSMCLAVICAALMCAAPAAVFAAPAAAQQAPSDPPANLRPAAPPADAPQSLTQYVHRSWTAEDGLPNDAVWSITRTRDGYLWIGTLGGLVRFDGHRFVPFTTRNTPELPNNGISALYEDADGSLWIGTLGGLTRYRDGRFTSYTTLDGLPSNNVWTVTGEPDGTLWVGTLGGLARLKDGRSTTYTTDDGLLTNDVRAISVADDGVVWFGTYGGGAHRLYDGHITAYSLVGAPGGPWLHRLLSARDGTVWVGVGQGQADRSSYQLLQLAEDRYGPIEGAPALYSVRALTEGAEGGLFIGTYGGGLTRYSSGEFQPFTVTEGLTDDRVQALHEDRDGNLWIGTMGGLDLLRRSSPFTTIAAEEGLPNDNVRGVIQDDSGAVWIATAAGLARLAADGITAFGQNDGLPEPFVQAVWVDRNGTVWLGGQNSVTRFANGMFMHYDLPEEWPAGVVRSIVNDEDGQLWLGSVGGGLVRFEPGRSIEYTVADGLAHNSVTTLLASGNGGLWVGTARGLNRMLDGRIRRFDGEEKFAGINIRSLYEDDEGTLWVGTYARGLLRYHEGRVAVYTVREGLHDDGVWAILEDDDGALWMSSNRGVSRVMKTDLDDVASGRRSTLSPINFGVADGMKTAEANGASKPSGWRSHDGRMWFATQRGVVVVDPAEAQRSAPAPIVEEVRSDGERVGTDNEMVTLRASARDFSVAYTSLGFADPERIRFRYRLDGFTDGWVDAEERREAIFTNVPADSYIFRVAARNGNGEWVEGESLSLVVEPFLWETAWFRLLLVLSIAGLVTLAFGQQRRHQRQREAALEAQVAARTNELRRSKETTEAQAARLIELDEAKNKFFANVSHEFRTPLMLTIGPLDDLKAGLYGPMDTPMAQQVDLARRSAARVLDLVDQILDVARLEAGRTPLRAGPLDVVEFIRSVATPFQALAERKAMTFEIDRTVTPVQVYADPTLLEKAVANLLSNALKFTPHGGIVRVSIAIRNGTAGDGLSGDGAAGGDAAGEETSGDRAAADAAAAGGSVSVIVRDNGPGIPTAELPYVFDRFHRVGAHANALPGTGIGLALAKEIIDLHGGTLTVQSEEGFGSTFTITLQLGKGHLVSDQIDEAADPWAPGSVHSAVDYPDVSLVEDLLDEDADSDKTTILVVEDHRDVRAYIRRHLTPAYRVLEARDGEQGLSLARERLPDLVLSDVMMSGMDGYELCRALKSDPATDFIPVILLTAKAAPQDKLEGLGELADDYLTKPFDPAELRARIENLIAVRRRLRERFRLEAMALAEGEDAPEPIRRSSTAAATAAEDAFLQRVQEAIEVHLGDDTFSVERLAALVGVSRGHLHRQLKSILGQTPTDLIRTVRLDRARHLLAGRAGTVSEIAYAVGFKSVGHFSDSFMKSYGCRPSDYADRAGASGDGTA